MDQSAQAIKTNQSLLNEIYKVSGEKIQNCYQCQKCSAGCPVNFAMDILPNQMFRHIQYNNRDKVLSSKTIWLCASCHTCSVRCPNSIDIAKVMDTLREHIRPIRHGSRRKEDLAVPQVLSGAHEIHGPHLGTRHGDLRHADRRFGRDDGMDDENVFKG